MVAKKLKTKKVPRKGVAKRPAPEPVPESVTVNIGGQDVEVGGRSLMDRVLDVLRGPGGALLRPEAPATAEDIASRLTGDWTPAELQTALRVLVDTREIASDSTGEATVYYLIGAAPVDEEKLLADARAELARIMAREDRPRATRSLECILTADEKTALRLRSGELRAQEVTELREVERLAALLKGAKERASALASLKDHEQDVAAAGREYRDVECQEVVLWAHGVALTFRADTGEEIERRTLEAAEERQGALFPAGAS